MTLGNRIPSLDGLRAIAVTLVVLKHMSSSHAFGPDYLWRLQLGDLGVRVFFVISGFLITHLLMLERESKGRIDLPAFYLRRCLRIFPAYFAFLGLMLLAMAVDLQNAPLKQFAVAALYLSNYLDTPNFLGHTWSLSVEEQFYLLWPGVLVLAGLRGSFRFALGAVIVAPVLRLAIAEADPDPKVLWTGFFTTCDAIATGCLFARWRAKLHERTAYIRAINSAWIPCVMVGIMLAVLLTMRWPLLWNTLGVTLLNVTVVVLIDACVTQVGSWHYRLLNCRPFVFVGLMSYSIYLWQQPFIYGGMRLETPLNFAAIIAAASMSYYCVERPALRLRHWMLRRRRPVVQG